MSSVLLNEDNSNSNDNNDKLIHESEAEIDELDESEDLNNQQQPMRAFNNDDNSTSNLAQAIDAPPHIRQLLSQSQRERIAHQVNSAILESQMLPKHPKLSTVLKLLSWGESNLSSRVNFPKYNPPTSTSINRNQQGNNNHPYNFNSSSNHTNSVGQFDEQMLT